ncbi:MAG: polysaccharide lyase [Nitrososphaera sp.]|nr:polysaccharide lyase [Nitrososphaera sp.]
MNLTKLRVVLALIITPTILSIPVSSYGGIIFQDDFESDPSNWACTNVAGKTQNSWLSKWTFYTSYCGSGLGAPTNAAGAEWAMGPGHNSNNAVYAWKHQSVPNGYRSESVKFLTGSQLSNEVYHRWYMKIPPNFDKAMAEGFKFWRYAFRENGFPSPPTLYLNVRGGTFAGGFLALLGGACYCQEWILSSVSGWNDNQWHSHEIRLKLNADGSSDGLIQYWLDGVLKATYTGIKFGTAPNLQVHYLGVGIGNVSQSPWYMTTWTPAAFDDVVVSTTYVGVGPSGGGSAALSAPANLRIQ